MDSQDMLLIASLFIVGDAIKGLSTVAADDTSRTESRQKSAESETTSYSTLPYGYISSIENGGRKSHIDILNDTVISRLITTQNEATTGSLMLKTTSVLKQQDGFAKAYVKSAQGGRHRQNILGLQKGNDSEPDSNHTQTEQRVRHLIPDINDTDVIKITTFSSPLHGPSSGSKPFTLEGVTTLPLPPEMVTSIATITPKSSTALSETKAKVKSPFHINNQRSHKHHTPKGRNKPQENKIFVTGYPRHHIKNAPSVKSSRYKRKHGDNSSDYRNEHDGHFAPHSEELETKPFAEVYGWLIGASMLILGSLITLTGGILLCYCGDKWKKHREERRRLEKYGEYERVESVSSLVSGQPPTDFCDDQLETVSMI